MAALEGFICPLCMQSLPGVVQLEKHVREEHDDTATGKMKANFKQFIGKAKTTLTKHKIEESEGAAAVSVRKSEERGEEEEGGGAIKNVSGINLSLWPEQEFGISRDHLDLFRRARDVKVQRISVETNRLLVRLEKLLRLLKNEHTMKQKQLKALEQDIVPWKRDSETKRCMKCSREFNIHRRKHHCRLCGDVICKKCSSFFPFSEAYRLMSDNPDYQSILLDPSTVSSSKSKKLKLKKLLKDKDEEDSDEEDTSDEMRVCPSCEELLVRHLAKMVSGEKTQLTGLYERMWLTMNEANKLKPNYLEMADSLLSGEYHFRLIDAHETRQSLVKLYEIVDGTSKAIMNLKFSDGQLPSPTCQKIQRNIRMYASTYLQENLLTLPALPNSEKLREIRQAKEREAEEKRRKLMKEKEERKEQEIAAAAAAIKKESSLNIKKDNTPSSSSGISFTASKLEVSFPMIDSKLRLSPTFTKKAKAVLRLKKPGSEEGEAKRDSGWTAESRITEYQDDEGLDPFELQRQQLLSYIAQAQQAKRFDEVATLRESLKEIETLMEGQQ